MAKLVTKAILKKMPKLYHYDKQGVKGENMIAQFKLFSPTAGYTWFGCEYDGIAEPEEGFYGLMVANGVKEYGYFYLDYLRTLNIGKPFPMPIERDRYFKPTRIGDLKRGVDYV